MTTIPARADRLPRTLASLERQNLRPDEVRIYYPKGYALRIPSSLQIKVTARPVLDKGPVTKISAVVDPEVPKDAMIITVDDDLEYAREWLETLVTGARLYPGEAVGLSGMSAKPIIDAASVYGLPSAGVCDVLDGFAGALYYKNFFSPDILEPPIELSRDDDIWISSYLARRGIVRRKIREKVMLDADHGRNDGLHTRPNHEKVLQRLCRIAFHDVALVES